MNSITDQFQRPLHDLRISVIDRCNFRCTYCMPEDEVSKSYHFINNQEWLTFEEIVRITKLFVQLGVVKVRLTGGEPLLRPSIDGLIRNLAKINEIEDLTLTTNGSLLKENALKLKKAGLARLTVSLDTLDSRVFKTMSGQKGSLDQVLAGIDEAEAIGFDKIKINVVVQKGVNDHTILDMVEYFKNKKSILRFIEYMDVGNCNHWQSKYVVPSKNIVEMIHAKYPIQPLEQNYFGEVAERYQFVDGSGELGFISSISQPFCQSCTRVRLSTDGKIYTCLFANEGTDLRTLLRNHASDDELLHIIKNVWMKREDRYSELRNDYVTAENPTKKVEMFQIGG